MDLVTDALAWRSLKDIQLRAKLERREVQGRYRMAFVSCNVLLILKI